MLPKRYLYSKYKYTHYRKDMEFLPYVPVPPGESGSMIPIEEIELNEIKKRLEDFNQKILDKDNKNLKKK